jgi:hypothetical protein
MKKIYLAIAYIIFLSLACACSHKSKTAEVMAEISETSVSETSAPVTEETTTDTTRFVYPDLTKDTFGNDGLEIYHTDFRPSEELESEIMYLINRYSKQCSLYMVNLEDYATFGYNSDYYIPTASTIKCPFAFYCYTEIQKENHSFDDEVLYHSGYYSSGTGVLKGGVVGTYYPVKELLYDMINYSDNVAFLMLQDYFGYEGYNEMMESYGFETFLDENTKWGKLSSHALGYIWTRIYNYKDECEEGAIFYDTLVNAKYNFFLWPFTDAGYEYPIAHKSGWASPGYHDSGIILTEHPYVLVVMTESEGLTEDNGFFYNITLKFNELHDEYLEYIGQEPAVTGTIETISPDETTTFAHNHYLFEGAEDDEPDVTDVPDYNGNDNSYDETTVPAEPEYVVESSVIYWTNIVY